MPHMNLRHFFWRASPNRESDSVCSKYISGRLDNKKMTGELCDAGRKFQRNCFHMGINRNAPLVAGGKWKRTVINTLCRNLTTGRYGGGALNPSLSGLPLAPTTASPNSRIAAGHHLAVFIGLFLSRTKKRQNDKQERWGLSSNTLKVLYLFAGTIHQDRRN